MYYYFRLFSCGTRKRSETQLVEWNVINGAIKREYSGLRKKFMGVIHFDTVRNRFLAAGDGFHIKFWDMDSIQVLKHTYADARLPVSTQNHLHFFNDISYSHLMTRLTNNVHGYDETSPFWKLLLKSCLLHLFDINAHAIHVCMCECAKTHY